MIYLILRLEAPLMSFGGPMIDRHGVVQPYPALSLLTGMLGNALGYDHTEYEKLNRLQERIQYAVREDRSGESMRDYQTVDLSKDFMKDSNAAWTTRGYVEKRKGGEASSGTHQRNRHYRADSVYTVALTLVPADEEPGLPALENALKYPERPLFIGRKTCLPSGPIFVESQEAETPKNALENASYSDRADKSSSYRIWQEIPPEKLNEELQFGITPAIDSRDWANQIHTGQRWIAEGKINRPEINKEGL